MSQETIVIEKNGKFGPMVNGTYYSFSKFYKGEKQLAVGNTYEVDVFISDSGKKYINAVVGEAPKIVAPVFNNTPVAKAVKDSGMSKDEWQAKDTRISRQGVWQAAVQALAPAYTELDKLIKEAEVLANAGLEYVNRK